MPSSRVREVLASGRRTIGERVIAFAVPGSGQVAFVAGRKVGKAVQRNRARRVLRAAWGDLSGDTRGEMDVVLVARRTILEAGSPQVSVEIAGLLRGAREVSA